MTERDAIFRQRLVAVMTALNGGAAKDPALRRALGTFVNRLVKQAEAHDWADLKNRADVGSYDAMLQLFQRESAAFLKKDDTASIRALEVLGISLIARHQQQADLIPGVRFLDEYIEECAATSKRASAGVLNIRPTAH